MKTQKGQKNGIFVYFGLCILVIAIVLVIRKDKPPAVIKAPPVERPAPQPTIASLPPPAASNAQFRSFKIETANPGAELAKEVGLSNVPFVLAFNRLDAQHIRTGVVLTIPTNLDDWDTLSPFPATLPEASDIPKILLVSQRVQAFGAYESGKLVRWGTVSTGKADTPTPSKLYTTNWKGKLVVSSVEDEWILPWYFNLDNDEGISLHQYALPGYPASHSCVRMSDADAEWIYNWADQWILASDGNTEIAPGTPVLVFGQYDYGKTAPWKNLPTDPTAVTISPEETSKAITPELTAIHAKLQQRAAVQKSAT